MRLPAQPRHRARGARPAPPLPARAPARPGRAARAGLQAGPGLGYRLFYILYPIPYNHTGLYNPIYIYMLFMPPRAAPNPRPRAQTHTAARARAGCGRCAARAPDAAAAARAQDLTGGNVLLTSAPHSAHGFCAKVSDFGAARAWACSTHGGCLSATLTALDREGLPCDVGGARGPCRAVAAHGRLQQGGHRHVWHADAHAARGCAPALMQACPAPSHVQHSCQASALRCTPARTAARWARGACGGARARLPAALAACRCGAWPDWRACAGRSRRERPDER